MKIERLDQKLLSFFRRISLPMARLSLFVVFFWFGALKVVGQSPASGVVERLFENTVPFMSFGLFIVLFGLFECLIGLLFLIRGAERVVLPLLLIHMITTAGPLFLLSTETWAHFLVPTLEGQYIIKNLAIIAVAISIVAHLRPLALSRHEH